MHQHSLNRSILHHAFFFFCRNGREMRVPAVWTILLGALFVFLSSQSVWLNIHKVASPSQIIIGAYRVHAMSWVTSQLQELTLLVWASCNHLAVWYTQRSWRNILNRILLCAMRTSLILASAFQRKKLFSEVNYFNVHSQCSLRWFSECI